MQAVKNKLATLKAKLEEEIKLAEDAERELSEIIAKAEELENEAEEKTLELNDIEDKLDDAEGKIQDFTEQLGTSEKSAEEGLQARKQLENRVRNDSNSICKLVEELEELNIHNAEIEGHLEKVIANITEAEETLDQEEERVEAANDRVKILEVEVIHVGNSLRSMEIIEGQAVVRSECGNSEICAMEEKYKAKEEEAAEFEEKAMQLELQSDEKEEGLAKAKSKYEKTKQELDALMAEINEI